MSIAMKAVRASVALFVLLIIAGAGLILWQAMQPHVAGEGPSTAEQSGTEQAAPAEMESQVVSLINGRRRGLGLGALHATYPLSLIARYHATDIGALNACQHDVPAGSLAASFTPAQRFIFLRYPGVWRGEVVGCREPTPEHVVDDWFNSPSHRAILTLPDVQEIGCGWYSAGDTGNWQTCEVAKLGK